MSALAATHLHHLQLIRLLIISECDLSINFALLTEQLFSNISISLIQGMPSFSFMIISSKFISHLVPLPFCIVFAQFFLVCWGIFTFLLEARKDIKIFNFNTSSHISRAIISDSKQCKCFFFANPKIAQISAVSERLYMNCYECNASDRILPNIRYLLPNDVTLFIFITLKLFHHLIQNYFIELDHVEFCTFATYNFAYSLRRNAHNFVLTYI